VYHDSTYIKHYFPSNKFSTIRTVRLYIYIYIYNIILTHNKTHYTLLLIDFPQSIPRPKKVFTWINHIHISLKLSHICLFFIQNIHNDNHKCYEFVDIGQRKPEYEESGENIGTNNPTNHRTLRHYDFLCLKCASRP